MLLELRERIIKNQTQGNPQLEDLLLRFQGLKPNLVPLKHLKRKKAKPKVFDSDLEKTFETIWSSKDAPENDDELNIPLDFVNAKTTEDKKTRATLIPPLIENEEVSPNKKRKLDVMISLHECKNVRDLANYLMKLKSPCQAMSLLGSPQTFCLILLNPNSVEMQERLSITLYYTLHNEFFSMSSPKGESKRRLDLLCRINQLQDFFQKGLPVVGRFLAEYLTIWNGEDYFFEICKMFVYLQLVDFNEIEDCILTPLRTLYNDKMSSVHQLFILNYLSRLTMHWATREYADFKRGTQGPFLTTDNCEHPMDSISQLVNAITDLAQSGLCKVVRSGISPDFHRTHMNIFLHECLSIFMTVSV